MSKNSIGIKYGIFAGVGLMLYFLLFYNIDKNTMLGMGVSWSSLLIVLFFTFWAVLKQRQNNGGIINFKEALKAGFLVYCPVESDLLCLFLYFIKNRS